VTRKPALALAFAVVVFLGASRLLSDEGMWMPQQIPQLAPELVHQLFGRAESVSGPAEVAWVAQQRARDELVERQLPRAAGLGGAIDGQTPAGVKGRAVRDDR